MTEPIRDLIPNLPDACIDCPALEAALYRINLLEDIVNEGLKPENVGGVAMIEQLDRHRTLVPALGELLVANCKAGPVVATSTLGNKYFGKRPGNKMCGSLHPIAAFIPNPVDSVPEQPGSGPVQGPFPSDLF